MGWQHVQVALRLIAAGADVNLKGYDADERTPLVAAVEFDPEVRGRGWTPGGRGQQPVVPLLICVCVCCVCVCCVCVVCVTKVITKLNARIKEDT